MQQGTQDQQVRAGYPGGECACPRDGFDQVPVDGPGVHLVTRRQVAHRAPLREEPAPQSGSVERLDGGHRCGPGGQQNQQVVERVARPWGAKFRGGVGEPSQRRGGDRYAGGRRGGGHPDDQAGVTLGPGVAGQDDLPGQLDDAFVQGPAHRSAKGRQAAPRQGVGRGPQARIDVVADRAGGVGEHAGQVESVADAQCGADLVGVLGQQLIAAAFGHPVQFGAHVEHRQVRRTQRPGRRVRGEPGIDVGELGDRQRVEQLDIPQPAHPGLQIGLGAVGDLAAALPARPGLLDEIVETGGDSGPPLSPRPTDQLGREFRVTGDVTGFQHRQSG